jgi:hypothetical protein
VTGQMGQVPWGATWQRKLRSDWRRSGVVQLSLHRTRAPRLLLAPASRACAELPSPAQHPSVNFRSVSLAGAVRNAPTSAATRWRGCRRAAAEGPPESHRVNSTHALSWEEPPSPERSIPSGKIRDVPGKEISDADDCGAEEHPQGNVGQRNSATTTLYERPPS